jgi:TP901 family phage tail tape measure protein
MAGDKIGIKLEVDVNDFKSALSEAGRAVGTLATSLKNDLGNALTNVANDENKLSTSANNAETQLKQQEKAVGGLAGTFKNLSSQLSQAGKDMETKFASIKDTATKVQGIGKTIGTTFTTGGVAIGAALGFAVKKAADFEQGMADIKAVSGATGAEMKTLSALAIEMGAKTKYSSIDAAKGIEELIKAGVSTKDIINGGLKGALDLATAGNLDLASAAEIASTALNAFKSDNLNVTDAANLLAGAANASATDVGELKYGLSMVSAVASGVGLSFKDTSTALAVFAQNGLKGSDAGTSLKTMLMNLQPSTEKQSKAFDELGLLTKDGTSIFYDASGSIKSMSEISDILHDKLGNLTDAQRQMALEQIFGSDAIRAGNILYKEGAKGVTDMYTAMSKVTAADVAATKMDTFKGRLETLNGSFETIQVNVGNALLPVINQFVGAIEKLTNWFSNLSPGMQRFIALGAALFAVLLILVGVLGFVASSLAAVAVAEWAVILPLIGWIAVAALVIAAVVFLVVMIKKHWDDIVNATVSAWNWVKEKTVNLFNSILDFLKKWGPTILAVLLGPIGILAKLIYDHWDSIKKFTLAIWDGIKSGISTAWNAVISFITNGFTAIKNGVTTAWTNVKDAFANGWNTVKDWAAGLWKESLDIGKNLVMGMVEGIKNVAGNLADSAKKAVKGAVDGAKKFLGIKSPSRVFMEIGSYTGEGFAIGLDKTQGDVMAASKSLSNSAVSAVDTSRGLTTSSPAANQSLTLIQELDGRVIAKNTMDYMSGTFRVRGAVT